MAARALPLLALTALLVSSTVHAQTLEITRELAAPEHHYSSMPPFFTFASDAIPFPALPNFTFGISDYDFVRLRLTAPPNMKYVVSKAVYFSWPGDISFVPTNISNSGTLHPCPATCTFTSSAGTPPVGTIEGYKTDNDCLLIRATGTSEASVGFEFTEIVLTWTVGAFTGPSHEYKMLDDGGYSTGPEVGFYWNLASGAPDPGQSVTLQPIATDVEGGASPETVALKVAGPNPFSSSTSIQFSQPTGGWVSLEVFDLAGHRVRTLTREALQAGRFTRSWNGKDDAGHSLPSGLYFLRIQAAGKERTQKIVVVR